MIGTIMQHAANAVRGGMQALAIFVATVAVVLGAVALGVAALVAVAVMTIRSYIAEYRSRPSAPVAVVARSPEPKSVETPRVPVPPVQAPEPWKVVDQLPPEPVVTPIAEPAPAPAVEKNPVFRFHRPSGKEIDAVNYAIVKGDLWYEITLLDGRKNQLITSIESIEILPDG